MNGLNLDSSLSSLTANSNQQTAAPSKDGSELGQSDFIELLVAQVKNQDPSKPMDPSQFMNQLAQFSTVNGIEELKTSFDSLAGRLSSDQSLQAASLIGRDVLVPSGSAVLEADGVGGQLTLTEQATEVTLKISDSKGALIRELSLGGHDGGVMPFKWDGIADDGSAAPPGNYHVIADAMIEGSRAAVPVEIETRVESISLNNDGSGTIVNLAGGDSMPLSYIQQIK